MNKPKSRWHHGEIPSLEVTQRRLFSETGFFIPNKSKNQMIEAPVRTDIIFPQPEDRAILSDAADMIGYYASQGLMLPQTERSLRVMAERRWLGVRMGLRGEVLITGALTMVHTGGFIEFGALAVHRRLARQRQALLFVNDFFTEVRLPEGFSIISFANSNSSRVFEQFGSDKMDEAHFHPSVFSPCATCPCKAEKPEGRMCVDQIYNLTNTAHKLNRGWR